MNVKASDYMDILDMNIADPKKKKLIINILEILRKYTDENHTLSQKQIIDILRDEYSMSVDRKSVARNLKDLIDCGYKIMFTQTKREVTTVDKKTGKKVTKENNIKSDYYLSRDFSDSELRLLIDSLLFSKHIPYHHCKELIEKLENLSSVHFKAKVKHIATFPHSNLINKQLFYTIDILDEAISTRRKVSFNYCEYGTDKKLHKKKRQDGTVREYIVSPYQMAAKEGKYYLICNYDKYNDISNYRIDRIKDIKILDEAVKPFGKLDGAQENSLDLARYMKEHVYMFSSGNVRAKFRVEKSMISDVIDMFTDDVRFCDETDTHVTVSAYTNEMAMHQFAKTFSPYVVVLSPKSLVDKIKADIKKSLDEYSKV